MTRIAQTHREGAAPLTLERLAEWLGLRPDGVALVVQALSDRGLLVETAGEPAGYLPRRSPDTIRVTDVLNAIRSADETPQLNPARLPSDPGVDALVERMNRAVSSTLEDETLDQLSRRTEG